jgi:hypothetical protein
MHTDPECCGFCGTTLPSGTSAAVDGPGLVQHVLSGGQLAPRIDPTRFIFDGDTAHRVCRVCYLTAYNLPITQLKPYDFRREEVRGVFIPFS